MTTTSCAFARRVLTVRLRLGALAGVAREALLFSFDIAAAGRAAEGA
jgi:Zn finger protein HypA/HybF involved in hydrogenase expression